VTVQILTAKFTVRIQNKQYLIRCSGDGVLVDHFLVGVLTYTGGRGFITCSGQCLIDLIDGSVQSCEFTI
jgi:hypothetical protein